jgi:hypothetical protein
MKRFTGSLIGCVTLGAFACATPASAELRHQRGGYDVEVLVDGVPAPTFSHGGESYVLGQLGERYVLRVSNHTGRRVEAVVSVDGRDVVDGKPADYQHKRGYLVPAWGSVDIDGWRLSAHQAAAFRFSSVADSYAARTGSAREVGVIGVAVFPERVYYAPPRYPYEGPPYRRHDEGRGAGPAAPAAEPSPSESKAPADAAGSRGGVAEEAPRLRRRPGLGTEFGEELSSPIREVPFTRAGGGPLVLGMRYNDRDGLVALGIDPDHAGFDAPDDTYLRQTATPFPATYRPYAAPPPGWRR